MAGSPSLNRLVAQSAESGRAAAALDHQRQAQRRIAAGLGLHDALVTACRMHAEHTGRTR
jgi:hypothetical protein